MSKKDIAKELTHYIKMYSHTNELRDQEYLAKVFYYAGLLAAEYLK